MAEFWSKNGQKWLKLPPLTTMFSICKSKLQTSIEKSFRWIWNIIAWRIDTKTTSKVKLVIPRTIQNYQNKNHTSCFDVEKWWVFKKFDPKIDPKWPDMTGNWPKMTKFLVLNQLFETNPDLKLSALFMEIFMWSYNDKQGMLTHWNDS